MPDVHPLRVLVKALIFFLLLNMVFAALNPPVGRLSIYNWLVAGRQRFPMDTGPGSYNVSVEDLDALFASHVISDGPKDPGEYRVLVLGDSQTWGWTATPPETLVGRLNSAHLSACGKYLKFYNLAYPYPSALRDFLVLSEGVKYKPDLVIWMLTTLSFSRVHWTSTWTPFMLSDNSESVYAMLHQYGLEHYKNLIDPTATFWERTLVGQSTRLSRLAFSQIYGLLWDATGIDIHIAIKPFGADLPAGDEYEGLRPPTLPASSLTLDVIKAAHQMVGDMQVLIVNEPIYMPPGKNSNIRYNINYPRWAYDQYRQLLSVLAAQQGWKYIDLYDLVPYTEFTNPYFHLTPTGEQALAAALIPGVLGIVCP